MATKKKPIKSNQKELLGYIYISGPWVGNQEVNAYNGIFSTEKEVIESVERNVDKEDNVEIYEIRLFKKGRIETKFKSE